MSIAWMTWVWDNADVSETDLICLLSLADWANDENGACWHSIKKLAARCRRQPRSTIETLKRLESAGYIAIEKRAGHSSIYRLQIPEQHRGAVDRTSGATSAPKVMRPGVHDGHADQTAQEPRENPQYEPSLGDVHLSATPTTEVDPVTKDSQLHRSPQDQRRYEKRNRKRSSGAARDHAVPQGGEPQRLSAAARQVSLAAGFDRGSFHA